MHPLRLVKVQEGRRPHCPLQATHRRSALGQLSQRGPRDGGNVPCTSQEAPPSRLPGRQMEGLGSLPPLGRPSRSDDGGGAGDAGPDGDHRGRQSQASRLIGRVGPSATLVSRPGSSPRCHRLAAALAEEKERRRIKVEWRRSSGWPASLKLELPVRLGGPCLSRPRSPSTACVRCTPGESIARGDPDHRSVCGRAWERRGSVQTCPQSAPPMHHRVT